MKHTTRKHLAVVAVTAATVFGTVGVASAKGRGDGTSSSTTQVPRVAEVPLTGEIATKVTAAALAAVPGGTVVRVETDTDEGGAYEAHVTDAAGTPIKLIFDTNLVVIKTTAETRKGGGSGSSGTALAGDVVAKVTAAALAAVPGGTVNRVESHRGATVAYKAHVTDASGNRVTVTLDSSYNVLQVVAKGSGKTNGHKDGKHTKTTTTTTTTTSTIPATTIPATTVPASTTP